MRTLTSYFDKEKTKDGDKKNKRREGPRKEQRAVGAVTIRANKNGTRTALASKNMTKFLEKPPGGLGHKNAA